MVQAMVDELRGVDYKATGTLQRSVDAAGRMSRDAFEGLLDAMVRAGLIGIEDAEYEKDGEVRRFSKVRLTEAGLELRAGSQVELLISDGVVEEFGVPAPTTKARAAKAKAAAKSGDGKAMSAAGGVVGGCGSIGGTAAGVACGGGKEAAGSGLCCVARSDAEGAGAGAAGESAGAAGD